jgi:tRNA-specific 2-thiouridylase
MSGGVDSSVAALLLVRQGYAVEGLFMKNWEEEDTEEYCAAAEDLQDAENVCAQVGIPLHSVNFSAEYWDRVFSYFLNEYSAGHTPNPDVLCNKEIKFRAFLDHALGLGADMIATGHYARISVDNSRYHLMKGRDKSKDQSYFLYSLKQHQLSRTLFPLGELEKSAVRDIARQHGLATSDKKDSTGICFIGERDFREFLGRYLPAEDGDMIDDAGHILGRHEGLAYYTIGQRQGLGIGGLQGTSGEPWFVAGKDMQNNTLLIVQGQNHPLLFNSRLEASSLEWTNNSIPAASFTCRAKTRYRQPDQDCNVELMDEDRLSVSFRQPQRALTPGQSVVFYDGDECLGGGIIDTVGG